MAAPWVSVLAEREGLMNMKSIVRVMSLIAVLVCSAPTGAEARQKYFGYFGSQFIGGNPDACNDTNYGGHINTVWLIIQNTSEVGDVASAVSAAAACGKKSIISVDRVFFDPSSNWELRWSHTYHTGSYSSADSGTNAAVSALQTGLSAQLHNIVAFFLFDEPFWHAQTNFDDSNQPSTCDGLSGVSGRSCHRLLDIQYVSAKMKAAFPTIPLSLNFANPELIDWHDAYLPKIPSGIDWVGFDCYMDGSPGTFDDCNGGYSIEDFVDSLKSKMSGAQKMFFVPPAFVYVETGSSGCPSPGAPASTGAKSIAALVDFLDEYRTLAENEPLVTGVFPYTWSSHCSGGGPRYYWGASSVGTHSSLTSVRTALQGWGNSIIDSDSNVSLVIDLPANNSQHIRGFTLAGWAIDQEALTGTGIDSLHVYAVPNAGAGTPIFLQALTVAQGGLGGARSDIATAFGPQYRNSGFGYNVGLSPSLGPDVYKIIVYPHSSVNNSFAFGAAKVVWVTIPASDVRGYLDTPANNATVASTFAIGGWAIDFGAPYGTGIDAIDVWACPTSTGCGGSSEYAVYLGPATYGGARSDIGAIFGSQFTNSGYGKVINTLAPGSYQLIVYARSTLTGSWTSWSVTVTVQ